MAESDQGKAVAILSYILVGIIWYFLDKKVQGNSFAKFHVKQALVVLIAALVIGMAAGIIPFIGPYIIGPVGGLFITIIWIFGLIYALSGQRKKVPLIGDMAKVFNF